MPLRTHVAKKYHADTIVGRPVEWASLRVEQRRFESSSQNGVRAECTEFMHVLSGNARLRRIGNGVEQKGVAHQGTSWLMPFGTEETLMEIDGEVDCLIVLMPEKLCGDDELARYGIDPGGTRLAYVGGFVDPTLSQIARGLSDILGREARPIDNLYVDGLKGLLAAHLLRTYTVDALPPHSRAANLSTKRLQRVIAYVDARLAEPMSLDDLANEACLSPYHFLRLFHEAMGKPPHRYIVERRLQLAREKLTSQQGSISEIALDAGFGSQANFSRMFRKFTGITPRQYRQQSAGVAAPA